LYQDLYELMLECWNPVESDRPAFREIHLFLQRKNLGYSPKWSVEDVRTQEDGSGGRLRRLRRLRRTAQEAQEDGSGGSGGRLRRFRRTARVLKN
jgi:hypothetical protein